MKQITTDQTDHPRTPFLYKKLGYQIVGAIFQVRNLYGSGQKELVYQNALSEEFTELNIPFKREVSISIKSQKTHKTLGHYKLDFAVDEKIIIEVKAVKFTPAKMEQQLYTYLRSTPYQVGYLVNFASTNLYCHRVILTNDRKKS